MWAGAGSGGASGLSTPCKAMACRKFNQSPSCCPTSPPARAASTMAFSVRKRTSRELLMWARGRARVIGGWNSGSKSSAKKRLGPRTLGTNGRQRLIRQTSHFSCRRHPFLPLENGGRAAWALRLFWVGSRKKPPPRTGRSAVCAPGTHSVRAGSASGAHQPGIWLECA